MILNQFLMRILTRGFLVALLLLHSVAARAAFTVPPKIWFLLNGPADPAVSGGAQNELRYFSYDTASMKVVRSLTPLYHDWDLRGFFTFAGGSRFLAFDDLGVLRSFSASGGRQGGVVFPNAFTNTSVELVLEGDFNKALVMTSDENLYELDDMGMISNQVMASKWKPSKYTYHTRAGYRVDLRTYLFASRYEVALVDLGAPTNAKVFDLENLLQNQSGGNEAVFDIYGVAGNKNWIWVDARVHRADFSTPRRLIVLDTLQQKIVKQFDVSAAKKVQILDADPSSDDLLARIDDELVEYNSVGRPMRLSLPLFSSAHLNSAGLQTQFAGSLPAEFIDYPREFARAGITPTVRPIGRTPVVNPAPAIAPIESTQKSNSIKKVFDPKTAEEFVAFIRKEFKGMPNPATAEDFVAFAKHAPNFKYYFIDFTPGQLAALGVRRWYDMPVVLPGREKDQIPWWRLAEYLEASVKARECTSKFTK